jgi:hypothetical protein
MAMCLLTSGGKFWLLLLSLTYLLLYWYYVYS